MIDYYQDPNWSSGDDFSLSARHQSEMRIGIQQWPNLGVPQQVLSEAA